MPLVIGATHIMLILSKAKRAIFDDSLINEFFDDEICRQKNFPGVSII